MAAQLAVNVVLRSPDGELCALLEGTEVPDWATGLLGGHCLVDGAPATPPRVGRGSSQSAWLAYAESLGLDLPADTPRAAIIAAVDSTE